MKGANIELFFKKIQTASKNSPENFKIEEAMLNFAPAKQSDGLSPLSSVAKEESPGSTEHSTS